MLLLIRNLRTILIINRKLWVFGRNTWVVKRSRCVGWRALRGRVLGNMISFMKMEPTIVAAVAEISQSTPLKPSLIQERDGPAFMSQYPVALLQDLMLMIKSADSLVGRALRSFVLGVNLTWDTSSMMDQRQRASVIVWTQRHWSSLKKGPNLCGLFK